MELENIGFKLELSSAGVLHKGTFPEEFPTAIRRSQFGNRYLPASELHGKSDKKRHFRKTAILYGQTL